MGNDSTPQLPPKQSVKKRPTTMTEFREVHKGSLVSSHNQQGLTSGICQGMVYDWIGALLNQQIQHFSEHSTNSPRRIKKVFSFQTQIQSIFEKNHNKPFEKLKAQEHVLGVKQKALLAQYTEVDDKMKSARRSAGFLDSLDILENRGFLTAEELDTHKAGVIRPPSEFFSSSKSRLDKLHGHFEVVDKIRKKVQKRMMDDEARFDLLYGIFKDELSKLDSPYGFDDIFYEKAKRHGWKPEELNEWLMEVKTCIHQLKDGCCAMLAVKEDENVGHAMAFHRKDLHYSLFDPNVGWYRVQGAESIWQLFADLWSCGYLSSRHRYNKSVWRVYYKTPVEPGSPGGSLHK